MLVGTSKEIKDHPDGDSCEFALVIADSMQGKGLGQKLMARLGFTAKISEEDHSIMKVSRPL